MTYGIDVKDMNDPMVQNAEEVLKSISAAGNPGSLLVDFIPISTPFKLARSTCSGIYLICSEVYSGLVAGSEV